MAITAEQVRNLREQTGAGMMDCKRALEATGGDQEKAIAHLRQQGLAAAARREGRVTKEGVVAAYIHAGGKIGVLVEVNCETDFAARTDGFQELAKSLAMQVAATSPRWLSREEVPEEVLEQEREIYRAQAVKDLLDKGADRRLNQLLKKSKINRADLSADELKQKWESCRAQAIEDGEPKEEIRDKIVEGRLKKFFEEFCLLEQSFIRDPDVKVTQLVAETGGKVGENVVVRRFVRFQMGQ